MISRKKKSSARAVMNTIPLNETNRLNSVFMLLMEIDKRIGHQQIKIKKTKKTNVAHGPLQRGSSFFFLMVFWQKIIYLKNSYNDC